MYTFLFVLFIGSIVTPVHAQQILFSDDFESEKPGAAWKTKPGEGGLVQVVNRLPDVASIPYSGDRALALGSVADGRNPSVNAADLHLDLSGQEEAILRFYIRDQADETSDEDAILLSDDGGKKFHRVLRLQPADWGDGAYGTITLNLAAAANNLGLKLNDRFVVRFQQSGTKDFAGKNWSDQDGFFIDDVVVLGAPTYASLPFRDGFESETLGAMWRSADGYNAGETALETQAQWGLVEPVQRLEGVPSIPRTGEGALAIGRPIGGDSRNLSVAAADLHLNLNGQEGAMLSFYIRDQADETNDEDAIYISDDGGKKFQRVLRLQPAKWGDGVYGAVTINLAAAARNLGLALSDKFVVRFQQSGNKDFAGRNWSDQDGFFIDDLVVQGAPAYATIPFEDGFESEALGASWRNADSYNAGETALEAQAQWGLVEPVQRLEGVPAIPRTGEWALAIGRPIGGDVREATVNAADLHLDLSGQSAAILRFYIRDQLDETNDEDAIYLSSDGGDHFVKALALDPKSRPDGAYSEVMIDLAAKAQELGLDLTDKFIIRIQQSGSRDFAGRNWSDQDGFFVDDLSVKLK
jgi:hypothetical protein